MIHRIKDKLKSFFSGEDERTILIKKNIVLSFLNKSIAIVISLQLVPMTINYINSSQYGVWLTLSSIVSWVAYFDMGFAHGFRNRFAEARAKGDLHLAQKYVSTTYSILFVVFVFIFLFCLFVNHFCQWADILNINSNMNGELSNIFIILIGFFCLQLILNVFSVLLLADQRPAFSSMINTLGQFLALVIIYILTKTTEGNLTILAFVLSGTPCISLFVISFFMYQKRYRQYAPSLKFVDFSLTKKIIGLGGKFFIIQISMLLIFQCVNIILSRVKGPDAVAEYNIAYKYFNVVYMIAVIVLTPFWSAFTDAYTKQDFQWMKHVYYKLSRMWLFAVIGCVILLVISPWVYSFWLQNTISIPFSLSIAMAIHILVLSRAGLYMQLINGTGKVYVQLLVYALFSLVSIPIMIWGCNQWGGVGVISVATFVFLLQAFLGHIQLHKIINNSSTGIWDK